MPPLNEAEGMEHLHWITFQAHLQAGFQADPYDALGVSVGRQADTHTM